MTRIRSLRQHLLLFVIIELGFIILLFREIPGFNFFTTLGLLHLSYWVVVFGAGRVREKMTGFFAKAFSTFFPIIYHVFIHFLAGYLIVDEHLENDEIHHEDEFRWLIISVLYIGLLVFLGEYLLHRTVHCKSHHKHAHAKCHDKECEHDHTKTD